MVLAPRSGLSIRSVAEQFGVNKSTVERWKRRTKGKRIDRIDRTDQADGPSRPANRSSEELEQCVLDFRKQLKEESILGEHGADAVLREMQNRGCSNLSSTATINRILRRHGAFDGRVRKRRTPPPPGGYFRVDFLALARKNAELDPFDYVEDPCIPGGTIFNVLNVVSLLF